MIQKVPLNCSVSTFHVEPNGFSQCSKSPATRSACSASTVRCIASRNYENIPKRDHFSSSRIGRALKEPTLIQKSVKEISDYCLTLEGDECYSCWEAYFDLKYLEEEAPARDVEMVINQSGGLNSLIKRVHNTAAIHKAARKERDDSVKPRTTTNIVSPRASQCPIPDGLPKTAEELKEEEEAKLQDSQFTRLLRVMGKYPAWYTPRPDHETD